MKKILISLSIIAAALIPAFFSIAEDNAIKTANYYLLSGAALEDKSIVETLALYDVLVLPAEAQVYNPDFPDEIRELNPDIILLAYVPSVSWNNSWNDRLHNVLEDSIKSSYWLNDKRGSNISIWPGTQALDLTSGWNHTLGDYVAGKILHNDYWDGVFFDEVSDEIAWVGDVKLSNNGSNVNEEWLDAYTELFYYTRELVGPDKIIISNGSSNLQHAPYVNGRMFESFPTPWEKDGRWSTNINNYLALEQNVLYEPVILINSDTSNTGNSTDYKRVRLGLSSALLGSGFFGFDFGTESHQQLWRFDEYDAYIGIAKDEAEQNSDGTWTRDFTNGMVIVNPTDYSQTIYLDGEFEKIRGTQDTTTNDGSIVTQVKIESKDGLILLRPIEEILNGVFLNGAFARVYNTSGEAYRNGFFSYDEDYAGGNQVIHYDLDFDGNLETVTANDGQVFIYDENGNLHASFYPYDNKFRGGINISVGDLESDGTVEIVTGTENGGGAHVRIFNANGVLINPGFFAYDDVYRGGVNVTIGDLNGDGWFEIICGAGVNGGPHVRIFNKDGRLINPGFFAYDYNSRYGVNVAALDTNGDGIDEILTGQGEGGVPEIKLFDKDGKELMNSFWAFSRSGNGVEVSAADLDGDGKEEIITFTQDVFTLSGI